MQLGFHVKLCCWSVFVSGKTSHRPGINVDFAGFEEDYLHQTRM